MIKKINVGGRTKYVDVSKEEYHTMLCESIKENAAIAKQVIDEWNKHGKFPEVVVATLVQAATTYVAYKIESILMNTLLKEQEEESDNG